MDLAPKKLKNRHLRGFLRASIGLNITPFYLEVSYNDNMDKILHILRKPEIEINLGVHSPPSKNKKIVKKRRFS